MNQMSPSIILDHNGVVDTRPSPFSHQMFEKLGLAQGQDYVIYSSGIVGGCGMGGVSHHIKHLPSHII